MFVAPPARPIPGLNLTPAKPTSTVTSPSSTPATTPATTPAEEKPKSGGFISRLFGSKSKDKIAEEPISESCFQNALSYNIFLDGRLKCRKVGLISRGDSPEWV